MFSGDNVVWSDLQHPIQIVAHGKWDSTSARLSNSHITLTVWQVLQVLQVWQVFGRQVQIVDPFWDEAIRHPFLRCCKGSVRSIP